MVTALVVDGHGPPPQRFTSCLAGSIGHRAACPRAIAAGSITSTPLNRVVRVKVAMDQHEAIENHVAADAETNPSVYVPTLQLTEGQPPPIAANGGLSYMSFDRDGDAGTAAAIEAALDQIAEGHAQAFIERMALSD